MSMQKTIAFLALISLAGLEPYARGQDISTKGSIVLSTHEVDMKPNNIYSIKIEGKGFQPRVVMMPAALPFVQQDFRKPFIFQNYYVATQDQKNTVVVLPELFGLKGKGPYEYSFEVKAIALGAELLNVKDTLNANDPPFKAEFFNRTRHKSYVLKVKAGSFYVIDMKEPKRANLDSYLILVDSKGKVVKSDDDSGGFPNARIIFHATEDGEFRIIATGLGQAQGDFILTVRSTDKK